MNEELTPSDFDGFQTYEQCRDAEIDRLKAEIERLKALLARAADALDVMTQFLLISDVPLEWEENKRRENRKLIAELRKAAAE